jgi:hypothetical protein
MIVVFHAKTIIDNYYQQQNDQKENSKFFKKFFHRLELKIYEGMVPEITDVINQECKQDIEIPTNNPIGENAINLQRMLFISLQPLNSHKQNKANHQRYCFRRYYVWDRKQGGRDNFANIS